jgi:hypothetical protein
MAKEKKTIEDFDCCPHCGSDFGYYQKVNYKGSYNDIRLFGSHEPYNSEMWSGAIETFRTKDYYCESCNKKICKA